MKRVVSNFLLAMVGAITGYLIMANIWHIIALNQFEVFDFSQTPMIEVRKNIDVFQKKMEVIEYYMDQSTVFSDEDKIELKDNLQELKDTINSNLLLNYTGKEKITLKFLYHLDNNNFVKALNVIYILNILEKYDPEVKGYSELYKADFLSSGYGKNMAHLKPVEAYRYITPLFQTDNILQVQNYDILVRIYDYNERLVAANYLSDMIIKVGELHA